MVRGSGCVIRELEPSALHFWGGERILRLSSVTHGQGSNQSNLSKPPNHGDWRASKLANTSTCWEGGAPRSVGQTSLSSEPPNLALCTSSCSLVSFMIHWNGKQRIFLRCVSHRSKLWNQGEVVVGTLDFTAKSIKWVGNPGTWALLSGS